MLRQKTKAIDENTKYYLLCFFYIGAVADTHHEKLMN